MKLPCSLSSCTFALHFLHVQELSVALTAGGLIDLLLDVRSAAEFEAGGERLSSTWEW